MASTTLLTAEQYLNMHFEDHEPEFVHGELIEKSMPTSLHAWLTHLLSMRVHGAGFCLVGVRCRVADQVFRIPDLAVFRDFPERVPTSPPVITIEIVSPEDRHEELVRKLEDYRAWQVPNIWVVEPQLKRFTVYTSGSLVAVTHFELADLNIRIAADELFAEADR